MTSFKCLQAEYLRHGHNGNQCGNGNYLRIMRTVYGPGRRIGVRRVLDEVLGMSLADAESRASLHVALLALRPDRRDPSLPSTCCDSTAHA
jgi:hypothetical protein